MTSVSRVVRTQGRDGATFAMHVVAPEGQHGPVAIVTHGAFSDARSCVGLARHLARVGFAVCIFEWRGHGHSGEATHGSFDEIARHDVPAAIEEARRLTARSKVFWIGHSGGALLPWMWAARTRNAASLEGVVALACQANSACRTWRGKVMVAAGAMLNAALGRTPALGFGPQDELEGVMRQWYQWNWTGRWHGDDGFEYDTAMQHIDIPAMLIAGAGDGLIAPEQGCRTLFDALGTSDKTFVLAARSTGFSHDYGHAGLVTGRGARQEIWPRVSDWMLARARIGQSFGIAPSACAAR
jgi:predicted alpha/beta hydrolase